MKRKITLLSFVAILCSCNQNTENNIKDNSDTTIVTAQNEINDTIESTNESTNEKIVSMDSMYKSPVCRLLDLKGDVSYSIIYREDSDTTNNGYYEVSIDKNGVAKFLKYEESQTKYNYDSEGRLSTFNAFPESDFDSETYSFSYDNLGLCESMERELAEGDYKMWFYYDNEQNMKSSRKIQAELDEIFECNWHYDILETDEYGNWTKRYVYGEDRAGNTRSIESDKNLTWEKIADFAEWEESTSFRYVEIRKIKYNNN